MGIYCIESMGIREKFQDAKMYDTETFLTIANLMGEVKEEDGIAMVDLKKIDIKTYSEESYNEFRDGIVFFIAAGLLKPLGEENYIVDMKKFKELSKLYYEQELTEDKGISKTKGTIK